MHVIRKFTQTQKGQAATIIALILAVAFIWFLPFLGFYWDDWLAIFHIQNGRYADLLPFYAYDRPLSTWTVLLLGPILGAAPLAWQFLSLSLRGLAAFLLFRIISKLFPRQNSFAIWAALLFAVYPAFTLQPISVAYSQHWISYAAYLLSVFLMLLAIERKEKRFWWTLLALFFTLLHLITLEYFAGLEILRPFLLALLLIPASEDKRKSLVAILRIWLPYLLVLVAWAVWRLFFLEFPIEPHPPVLLTGLRSQPLTTLLEFARIAWQSVLTVLFIVWERVFHPDFIDPAKPLFWLGITVAILSVGLIVRVIRSQNWISEGENQSRRYWQAALLGLIALSLGLVPGWIIGGNPIQPGYNERFSMAAMVGAALFFVGLVFQISKTPRARSQLMALFIGFAIFGQFNAAEGFRQDWLHQQEYFQQIAWRAPAIEPDTALIFYAPLTPVMPASATSAALNALYTQSRDSQYVDFWYFDLELSRFTREIEAGNPLSNNYRDMLFEAEESQAMLYFYQPEEGCLWLLSERDEFNPYLPNKVQAFAAYSNPARINPSLSQSSLVAEPIFNLATQQTWCFFYQDAARLQQLGSWEALITSQKVAQSEGLAPAIALEWLPLLEAYLQTGDWQPAIELSETIQTDNPRNAEILCAHWSDLEEVWNEDENGLAAWTQIQALAKCP